MNEIKPIDVAIIGGGVAGLVAANFAARAGRSVVVFERSAHVGGRAQTTTHDGFHLNLGAHALYSGGANAAVLQDLGIELTGGRPESSRYRALRGGRLYTLPTSALTLASTRLLRLKAKIEFGRLLGSLGDLEARDLNHVSLREWMETHVANPAAREAFAAVTRVSTYTNDPERVSAGAIIRQLQHATAGVRYLDGGWQSLIEALQACAIGAGARVEAAVPVKSVLWEGNEATGVELDGGKTVSASAVVIAAPPAVAAQLTGLASVRAWERSAIPVRAAVVDLGLSRLPNPRRVFSLGIDRPTYFSVHSEWADLAPDGGRAVHLMKYLPPEGSDPGGDERELDDLLEFLQPGWRAAAIYRRFLPDLAVAGWLPEAATGGLDGRPGPAVPGVRNLFVAGDWVGSDGMLADAAFASGKLAGSLAASATMAAMAPA